MSTQAHVAHIQEQFGMPLAPSDAADDQWFLDWVLKSPKEVSRHLTAGWHAYSSLLDVYQPEEIETAFEFFGGMGAQALMIQRLFAPQRHVVCDYSPAAVAHLSAVLPSPIWASQQDAYAKDLIVPDADLVGLDFGDLTIWRLRPKEKQRILLEKVVANHPKAFVLTDIAGPRLGLQRERYETFLGKGSCASHEVYLESVARFVREEFGYELQAGFRHHWSAVMAFVPEGLSSPRSDGSSPSFRPTPDTPVGLEIL